MKNDLRQFPTHIGVLTLISIKNNPFAAFKDSETNCGLSALPWDNNSYSIDNQIFK
jgi:hypothetical protein